MSPNHRWISAVLSDALNPPLILGADLQVQDGIMDPRVAGLAPDPEARPGTGVPEAALDRHEGPPAPAPIRTTVADPAPHRYVAPLLCDVPDPTHHGTTVGDLLPARVVGQAQEDPAHIGERDPAAVRDWQRSSLNPLVRISLGETVYIETTRETPRDSF